MVSLAEIFTSISWKEQNCQHENVNIVSESAICCAMYLDPFEHGHDELSLQCSAESALEKKS